MNPLQVGSVAPDFELTDQTGAPFRLSSVRGKHQVLLIFLPAAWTPICSTEVPATAVMLDQFLAANTLPFVVDVDNNPSNLSWSRDCGGQRVRILSDFNPHGAVSRAYGILAPDGVSERSTFLIGTDGLVKYSNVAGRFGKRSVPGLLQIASAVAYGRPITPAAAAAGVLPKLDLPVIYTMAGCSHCAKVKAFLATSGLSRKVVVKDVADQQNMRELLEASPDGGVPTLVLPNGTKAEGDQPIIDTLKKIYKV